MQKNDYSNCVHTVSFASVYKFYKYKNFSKCRISFASHYIWYVFFCEIYENYTKFVNF